MAGLVIEEREAGKIVEIRMEFNEKNTFDFAGLQELIRNLRVLAEREPIRVLVLSSGSDQFFSNGLDPGLFLDQKPARVREGVELLMEASQLYFHFPVPTIARINGHCLAGGAVFAIFSDYRYMVDRSARIGFSEAKIGLNFPSFPARVLTDLVGYRNARDLLYSGDMIKPDQALAIGLVDRICPLANLVRETEGKALELAKLTGNSARGLKTALRDFYEPGLGNLVSNDLEHLVQTIRTEDGQEGFRSIQENRRPSFSQSHRKIDAS